MNKMFAQIASAVALQAGRPAAFLLVIALVIGWALTAPLFAFSDTWLLAINTGSTIVTLLMVFLIQNTHARDGAALQAKLDELIRSSQAQNHFIGIEHLTDEEIAEFRHSSIALAKKASERAAARKSPMEPARM